MFFFNVVDFLTLYNERHDFIFNFIKMGQISDVRWVILKRPLCGRLCSRYTSSFVDIIYQQKTKTRVTKRILLEGPNGLE